MIRSGAANVGHSGEPSASSSGEHTAELERALRTGYRRGKDRVEYATTHGAGPEQNGWRLTYDAFNRQRAPTAKRTDLPPMHAVEQLFIDCSGRRRGRGTSGLNGSW